MKVFLYKSLIFIALFFLVDYLLGFALEKAFYRVKSGTIYQSVYGLRDCKEDILIMGASEVKHGLISTQFEDSLGLSCYNLGFDGNNIYYHYAILREILERHKPRVVIISTTVAEEKESTVVSLLPFRNKYSRIGEMISDISPVEKLKLLSKAYAYNSLIINIIQGHMSDEPQTKGYKPLYAGEKNMKLESRDYFIKTSPRSMKYFEDFIELAVNSGCEVVVVNTPKYFINDNSEKSSDVKELIFSSKVLYLDYENDTTYINHRDMFYDGVHLNHKGAEKFTGKFISDLKEKSNLNSNLTNNTSKSN